MLNLNNVIETVNTDCEKSALSRGAFWGTLVGVFAFAGNIFSARVLYVKNSRKNWGKK